MQSKKTPKDLPKKVFDLLLKSPAVVESEEGLLYVLVDGVLYEYRLPELEEMDEFGRGLITSFQEDDHLSGLAWLVVMTGNGLIADQPVLQLATSIMELTLGVFQEPSPGELVEEETEVTKVLVIEESELIRLLDEHGPEKTAQILEMPLGVVLDLAEQIELSR